MNKINFNKLCLFGYVLYCFQTVNSAGIIFLDKSINLYKYNIAIMVLLQVIFCVYSFIRFKYLEMKMDNIYNYNINSIKEMKVIISKALSIRYILGEAFTIGCYMYSEGITLKLIIFLPGYFLLASCIGMCLRGDNLINCLDPEFIKYNTVNDIKNGIRYDTKNNNIELSSIKHEHIKSEKVEDFKGEIK